MDQAHNYADTVTVEKLTGQGAKGDPQYATGVSLVCRVRQGTFRFRDAEGQERAGSARIRFSQAELDAASLLAPTTDDRVTLPNGVAQRVLRVDGPVAQFSGEPGLFELFI